MASVIPEMLNMQHDGFSIVEIIMKHCILCITQTLINSLGFEIVNMNMK